MGEILNKLKEMLLSPDEEQFIMLIEHFKFENLLNFNVNSENEEKIRICVQLLLVFSQNQLFYKYNGPVKYTFDFILINIPVVLNANNEEFVTVMFNILDEITSKILKQKELYKQIINIEVILNVFLKIIQIETFNEKYAYKCSKILRKIILNTNDYEENLQKIVTTIQYLLKFELTTDIIEIFHHLYKKNQIKTESLLDLYQYSDKMCLLSTNIVIRPLIFKLLGELILYYTKTRDTDLIVPSNYKINAELTKLPIELNKWPNNKSIFLYICHFLLNTSSLLWSEETIFDVIANLFYSIERYTINPELLKTICYLYANLNLKNDSKAILLGRDISRVVMDQKKDNIIQIVTLKSTPNNWFLMNGSKLLKMHILSNILHEKSIINFIISYRLQSLLCDILLMSNFPKTVYERAVTIINELNDEYVNEKITLNLIQAFYKRDKDSLRRLLQCPLKAPQNKSICIKFCRIISHLIPQLNGGFLEQLLNFLKDLFISLKNEIKAFEYFCERIDNIKILIKYLNTIDCILQTKIHNIFYILMVHQKRNKIFNATFIEIDFIVPIYNEKSLNFISMSLNQNLLIRLKKSLILPLSCALFDICINKQELTCKSYDCLIRLLENNTWLINSLSFNYNLEIVCSTTKDNINLLELVALWIHLSSNLLWNISYIPNDSLSTFISRAEIPKNKKRNLLNKLRFILHK